MEFQETELVSLFIDTEPFNKETLMRDLAEFCQSFINLRAGEAHDEYKEIVGSGQASYNMGRLKELKVYMAQSEVALDKYSKVRTLSRMGRTITELSQIK